MTGWRPRSSSHTRSTGDLASYGTRRTWLRLTRQFPWTAEQALHGHPTCHRQNFRWQHTVCVILQGQKGRRTRKDVPRRPACVRDRILVVVYAKASVEKIELGDDWSVGNYEDTQRHPCLGRPASQTSIV